MKKLGWLSGIGLLLMPALAAAQTSAVQKILDVLNTQVGFLFYNFNLGDRMYMFYIKFCLWIIIFSIMFYAGGFVFRDSGRGQRNRGTRITLAIVIALISAIAIPDEMVKPIIESYGIVAIALLAGIPLFGVIYFNHVVLPRQGGAFHGFRAAIYYILALLITNIVEGVRSAQLFAWVDDLYFWGSLARDVCLILMIGYVIAAIISAFRRDAPEAEGGGETIWDRLRGMGGGGAPARAPDGRPYPADLAGYIQNLVAANATLTNYYNANMATTGAALIAWRNTLVPPPPGFAGGIAANNYTALPAPGAPIPAGSCWATMNAAGQPRYNEIQAYLGYYNNINGNLIPTCQNLVNTLMNNANAARLNNRDMRALTNAVQNFINLQGQIIQARINFQNIMGY